MRNPPSSRRSWILAVVALMAGLGLYVYDDWCESLQAPIAQAVLNAIEIIVMGPGMAVLAYVVSEWLRIKDEQHRQRLEAERERRFRFLGRIAASVAHEVQNPLHNIQLLKDELRTRSPAPDGELLQGIADNLERLNQATRLIYVLARPPEQAPGDADAAVDVGRLIDEVVAETQRRAVRQASVERRAPDAAVVANANRETLRMVLQNLVRNAIEAADGAAVELAWGDEAGSAVVLIRNPGAIPPEFLSEDADAISRKPGGLGVGITIARHLTAALGGRLRFDCGSGVVSARLELPRAR